MRTVAIRLLPILVAVLVLFAPQREGIASSSMALGYTPKYPPGFKAFDYVNPDAPKGGEAVLPAMGNYDSFNPYLLKGISAAGLEELVFESLTVQSLDEPYSIYGLLAEDMRVAPDQLSVTFRLNPHARFSDGSPVQAEDVKFSFDSLRGKTADPRFRMYWADIKDAVVIDPLTVQFRFAKRNPELHMLAGQVPVFSRNWAREAFTGQGNPLPIGSGPYTVSGYQMGRSINYARNPRYWARDLNVRKGMYNFDRVRFIYYQDEAVALEGLKAGEFEFMYVLNSKQWARDYGGPKFKQGLIKKAEFKHRNDEGMQGFGFNLRRDLFKDKRVRQAIGYALDFEWSNRNLFYNQYTRCYSYFSNSDLAATGVPQGDELALLEPYRAQLPAALFSQPWSPPSTSPPHSLRENLRKAKVLLTQAGWTYRDGALRNSRNQPLEFELLLAQKAFERIAAPFAANLSRLGIKMHYRTVDGALYQRRLQTFDFDMVVAKYSQSQSPGNELLGNWHSKAANEEGSNNILGIRDPVVDAMIQKVIYSSDRAHLVTAVHALDRVMLHGQYLVPNWFIGTHRVAYWDRFGWPQRLPLYYEATAWMLQTWWKKP